MKTLRYKAPAKNVLVAGGQTLHGGETARFSDEDALRLLTDPNLVVEEVDEPHDLNAMHRDQLDELAEQLGVENPKHLRTKGDVIDAIEAVESGDAEHTNEEDESAAGDGEGHDERSSD